MGNRLDVDLPEYPLEIVFVLVRPEFPGNIGAVCRGMLNFGFDKLRVIGHDVLTVTFPVELCNKVGLFGCCRLKGIMLFCVDA